MLYYNPTKVFCALPWNRAKITSDGRINMCCHQSEQSYLGSLLEHTFEELWFGPKAVEIREVIHRSKLHSACATKECPFSYLTKTAVQNPVNPNGYPSELEFDLFGGHCNYGGANLDISKICIMCPRARPDFAQHLLEHPDQTELLVDKVKHIVPHLKILNVLGIAESFWRGKIFSVLEQMNFAPHRDRICVWTTTNGSVFNKAKQDQFLSLVKSSNICFSLDAGTPETYLRIRRNDLFGMVCENLKMWCKRRTRGHSVSIYNNINTLNVGEIPQMITLAKDAGVDSLVMVPTHECGTSPELLPYLVNAQNASVFAVAQTEAIDFARKLGQKIEFPRPLNVGL